MIKKCLKTWGLLRGDKIPNVRGNGWKLPLLPNKVGKRSETNCRVTTKAFCLETFKLILTSSQIQQGPFHLLEREKDRLEGKSVKQHSLKNQGCTFFPEYDKLWCCRVWRKYLKMSNCIIGTHTELSRLFNSLSFDKQFWVHFAGKGRGCAPTTIHTLFSNGVARLIFSLPPGTSLSPSLPKKLNFTWHILLLQL